MTVGIRLQLRIWLLSVAWGFSTGVAAAPVDDALMRSVARAKIEALHSENAAIASTSPLSVYSDGGVVLCTVFSLRPAGFVVVSADDDLPPVVAYSFSDDIPRSGPQREKWLALIRMDLSLRLAQVSMLPEAAIAARREAWLTLIDGDPASVAQKRFEQWPAAGTTPTGGWLEQNWHQGAPYNAMCPIDPVTGARSVAGCPAVAMAQILHYHHTTNHTRFSDDDDYFHGYSGRNFWIDDDYKIHDFASFPDLNAALEALLIRYRNGIPITNDDRAALTFACGVAAHQVYTSSVSGTFGVSQAVQAYTRFGVTGFELLGEFHPDLYARMADNMKHALPVHFAVLDPGGGSGHNLVVDGYNTDDYFHLNFGWGGSSNGWYLLPDEIPYSLTQVEGAIVDIEFPDFIFADGFESGDCSNWSTIQL